VMNTRRIAFVLAAVTAGMLGVASAAWACVPGHDHGGAEATGHSVDPAIAPALPVPTVVPAVQSIAAPANTGFGSQPGNAADDGSSIPAVGYVVVVVGVALLLAGIVAGVRKSRSGAPPQPLVD